MPLHKRSPSPRHSESSHHRHSSSHSHTSQTLSPNGHGHHHSSSGSHLEEKSGFLHPFHGRVSGALKGRHEPDEAYLSYGDVRLTREDVDTLHDDWLTDNILAFWQEYMEHEIIPESAKTSILLIRPSMSFLLANHPDPADLVSALPPTKSATHLFLPVNDNSDLEHAEGGSHWSLLVADIPAGKAWHYDSLGGINGTEAEKLTSKVSALLSASMERRINLQFVDVENAPQQENGSDCGVFVCLVTREILVKKLSRTPQGRSVDMGFGSSKPGGGGVVTSSTAGVHPGKGRVEITKIIHDLRKEGKKDISRSASPGRKKSPPRIE